MLLQNHIVEVSKTNQEGRELRFFLLFALLIAAKPGKKKQILDGIHIPSLVQPLCPLTGHSETHSHFPIIFPRSLVIGKFISLPKRSWQHLIQDGSSEVGVLGQVASSLCKLSLAGVPSARTTLLSCAPAVSQSLF